MEAPTIPTLDLRGHRARVGGGPARRCTVRGCTRSTFEQKPYCVEHVGQLPYVQGLVAEVARRDKELDTIRTQGPGIISPPFRVVRDTYRALKAFGSCTLEELRDSVGVPPKILQECVGLLAALGVISPLSQSVAGEQVLLTLVKPVKPKRAEAKPRKGQGRHHPKNGR